MVSRGEREFFPALPLRLRFGGLDVVKLISLANAVSFEGREFLFVDEFPLENFDVEALEDLSFEDEGLLEFRGDSS